MGRFTPAPEVKRTPLTLLLAVLILALGGCGGTSSEEGEKTSARTSGEEAPVETDDGGTTNVGTGARKAIPDDVLSITVRLVPSESSSVSGTAILADVSGGLEVTLNAQNLPGQPGAEHLAHIHEGGTCADGRVGNSAPVGYPLEPVVNGQGETGSSTTLLSDIDVVQLFSGAPKYVDVHDTSTDEEALPTISCADIYTTTGGD